MEAPCDSVSRQIPARCVRNPKICSANRRILKKLVWEESLPRIPLDENGHFRRKLVGGNRLRRGRLGKDGHADGGLRVFMMILRISRVNFRGPPSDLRGNTGGNYLGGNRTPGGLVGTLL